MFVIDQKQAIDSLEALELRLNSAMQPVSPDPTFISHLRSRLHTPEVVYDNHHPARQAFVLVALGLFTGALLTWLLRKVS